MPLFPINQCSAPQIQSGRRCSNGVWLMPEPNEEGPCAVDTEQPVSKWPKCADWAIYRGGQWFERDGDTGIATKPVRGSIVVAGGDVAIIQVEFPGPDERPEEAPTYAFAAFDNKPAARANLRSVPLWIVMCGTYQPRGTAAEDEADEKLVRYPGFDEKCRPASVQVLRDAAAASRPPDGKRARLQWVRATLD